MPTMSRPPRGLALRHVLYALIAIALVAFGVTRFVGREPGGPAPNPTLMDPVPYRGTILELEAVLYREGAAALGDADRVSRLATQLGTALLRAPNRLQGQRAGREVMAFASRIGRDAGSATLSLPRAQADWERVRDKLFQPAPWFRSAPN